MMQIISEFSLQTTNTINLIAIKIKQKIKNKKYSPVVYNARLSEYYTHANNKQEIQ